ncbi:SusE domain-containing protein [Hymenobacter nivis]|uniref:SusF/SusE family outer membrane protein n=1 Tax=Hymenobacter nivis TaxID=1850093 RepID=A0A502GMT3_9BACT|nr:SusE domain-containing protein [Hymenobacter nivis]TPG63627.1 SusF/SusE family outer membrane protein [Hymenobacter nivis]
MNTSMKNWLTQAAGICTVAAVALTGCKKDEVQATITPTNAPTLAASTTAVVLAQANAASTAVTYTWTPVTGFTWTNTDAPYNPAITYQLQIDKKGGAFTAPATIDAGTSPTNVTVEALNTALTTLGIAPGTATPVDVRLNARYASNTPQASPVVPLTVTSYKACVAPNSDSWGVVGDAADGWPDATTNTDVPLTYNCDTKTYDITRAFKVGAFKIRLNKAWTVDYGSSSSTGGPLVKGGGNISIATAGTYTVKFDIANLKYTITK